MTNIVIETGRLTANPEITTKGENYFCRFTIAVQRPKKKGAETSDTDFFQCIAWNKNADVVHQWYKKGDMISVVGNLRSNSYEKNGEKRTSVEIKVNEVHFTGGKKEDNSVDDFVPIF